MAAARRSWPGSRRAGFSAGVMPWRRAREQETPLYLEITALLPEHEVRAVLRNDDSWHIGRAFQGTWSADDRFEKPVLHLVSSPGQAVRGAGPFLENTQTWTFNLVMDAQSELTEQNRFYKYRFQSLTPEQAAAARTRLEGEFAGAIAATEPGAVYLGNAISRASGASEPVLLRFAHQAPGGDSLEAAIESTTHAWKRPLRGSILANARRSGGAPIRLRAGPSEAGRGGPRAESILGDPGDLDLQFGLDQGALVGGDQRFTYRLAVAKAADLQQLEAARLERVRRLAAVLRDGIVFDGVIRDDRGYTFRTRFEFNRIDRTTGAITARIRSLGLPNVYREFAGAFEPAGDSIALDATERGALDRSFNVNIPFLVTSAPATAAPGARRPVGHGPDLAGNPALDAGFPGRRLPRRPDRGPRAGFSVRRRRRVPGISQEGGSLPAQPGRLDAPAGKPQASVSG